MEVSSSYLIPLLCILPLSPITWICIGWLILSVLVGVRVEAEAGFRLFLLGLGLLLAITAIGVVLFYLPDWMTVLLVSITTFLPWVWMLRYLTATKFSGKLLMALPTKNEKWSTSIMSGAFLTLLGLQNIIFHNNNFLTPAKSYTLGIWLISLGVFRALQRTRYAQIREAGILSETGTFYKWDNIENYGWKFGEDKLSLNLRKAIFKKNVSLKILSQFRKEVVAYLTQNVRIDGNNSKGYVPVKTAG